MLVITLKGLSEDNSGDCDGVDDIDEDQYHRFDPIYSVYLEISLRGLLL
jgi:hypothetical protein